MWQRWERMTLNKVSRDECCPTCGERKLTLRERLMLQVGLWEYEKWSKTGTKE